MRRLFRFILDNVVLGYWRYCMRITWDNGQWHVSRGWSYVRRAGKASK